MRHVLIGNSFPVSLIQRRVVCLMIDRNDFLSQINGCKICSFWGHANTLKVAGEFAGVDLAPRVTRPVMKLSECGLPMLDGIEFNTCWILSPLYARNFRPAIGEEVDEKMITDWRIVKMEWRVK